MARSYPWPSDEDLAYTMISAISKCSGKNYMSQIECADLENEAKTTRNASNSAQAVNPQPGFRLQDS